MLPALRAAGHLVARTSVDDPQLALGVNDRVQLAAVRAIAQRAHPRRPTGRAGVTIVDPGSTLIDVGVTIGADTVDRAEQLPARRDARSGAAARSARSPRSSTPRSHDEVTILHSYVVGAEIESTARRVGPFAYLRPGTRPARAAPRSARSSRSRTPTSARAPRSRTSPTSATPTSARAPTSAPATITANYDGVDKHRTTIGADVHTGVDTTLVAPVTLGDDAYTAAGSVDHRRRPGRRARRRPRAPANVEGYADRKRRRARRR